MDEIDRALRGYRDAAASSVGWTTACATIGASPATARTLVSGRGGVLARACCGGCCCSAVFHRPRRRRAAVLRIPPRNARDRGAPGTDPQRLPGQLRAQPVGSQPGAVERAVARPRGFPRHRPCQPAKRRLQPVAGRPASTRHAAGRALSLELPAPGGERRQLGELEIAIDLAAVYRRLVSGGLASLLWMGSFLCGLAVALSWLFHSLVTRHLWRMSEFAGHIAEGDLQQPL